MKSIYKALLTYLVVATFIISINTQEWKEEEDVLVLSDSNFDDALKEFNLLLVEFYAPWCGHCKALAPEYAKAAKELKENDSGVRLAKVDATEHRALAERFNIEGFPTLKFFIDSKEKEYTGGRTSDDIVQWVLRKSGPSVVSLESVEGLKKLIEDNETVAVYFGKKDGDIYNVFNEVGGIYEAAPLAQIDDEAVAKEYGAEVDDIVLFKNYDDKKNIFDKTKERSIENIMDFLETNSIRLVSPFDEKTAEFIFGRAKVGLFLYRDAELHKDIEAVFAEVAPEYKGRIYFVANNITGELEEKLAEFIGITSDDLPTLRIHDIKEQDVMKYSLKKEITKENIREFLEDFLAGKLEPEYKSEEVLEQDPNSNVIKVVGKSFNEIVKDENKDVLLKWYAPWCGHCQAIAPKWENLANKLKDYSNIVVAKIDATANEVPGEAIEGYPTLRFYSHKNKEAVDLSDLRSEYKILEFLREQELKQPIGEEVVFEPDPEDDEEHDHEHDEDDHDHEHDDDDTVDEEEHDGEDL